eukprot:5205501-Alexandrium_andersonii.AAC.1
MRRLGARAPAMDAKGQPWSKPEVEVMSCLLRDWHPSRSEWPVWNTRYGGTEQNWGGGRWPAQRQPCGRRAERPP